MSKCNLLQVSHSVSVRIGIDASPVAPSLNPMGAEFREYWVTNGAPSGWSGRLQKWSYHARIRKE